MTEIDENMVKSYGKAIAKAQVLDALVNVALENMILSSIDGSRLPVMKEAGASVLMLIKAFFPEEYDFKEAQLQREREEARNELIEKIKKEGGFASGEENL